MAPQSSTFQSTLSVRRATALHAIARKANGISIHALRKESDQAQLGTQYASAQFQSTLSVRRATRGLREHHRDALISIHALRKESDAVFQLREPFDCISIHALRKESD